MSKDLNQLHPKLREQAQALQSLAKERFGLRVIITQTTRTKEEQAALYSQGRDSTFITNSLRKVAGLPPITNEESTKIVTKAKTAEDSMHYYGLAFDIAITDATGKHIDWTNHSDWNGDKLSDWAQVGSLADELGLEWGGNWTGMPDPPHFQNRLGLTLAQLKSGVRPT